MRNDDLSQSGNHHPTANDDYDVIPAGTGSTATGNTITGRGTISGAAGADDAGVGGHVTGITGAGASDAAAMEAHGRYGAIKIDAQGNYTYTRNHGSPDNVEDVFTYTLADKSGALDSARLVVRIEGKEEQAKIQDNAQRIVAGNEVITLPPGVELSDIHVVGRDLVIDLPDGTQMVITDGAVFVPQLALGDVEIPSDTLASLLIDSEPRPAAGPPQSSGGNFGEPVAPLDPGVPLGDLLPPTELNYTPPEFEETYIPQKPNSPDFIPIIEVQPDGQPASIAAQDNVDEAGLPTRPGEPAGSNSAANSEVAGGNIIFSSPDGVASISISINGTNYVVFGPGAVTDIPGDYGTLHINSVNIAAGTISYTYTLLDNVNHQTDTTPWEDFAVHLVDSDGDVADATLRINIADDVPHANADVDSVVEDGALIADGNVFSGTGGSDANATDGVADVPGADGATVTGVAFGETAGALGIPVQGTYGDLVLSSTGAYVYTLHNDAPAVQALGAGETRTDVFTYTITDGDGDTSTTTLTITVTGTNDRPVIVSGSTAVTEEAFLAPEDNQGNPDGVGNPTDTASSASSSGQLSITDVDGDSLSVSLSAPAGSFYSHGQLITWAVSSDGHTLTGSTGEGDVITVTIDNAGNYTVNLLEQIDHPVAGTSPATSEDIVDMVVGVHVNDGTVTVDGSLTVHVEDDSPIVTGEPVIGVGVDLDESNSGTPVLSPAGAITVSSTGAIISAPVAYGGDGPGGAPVYTITLNGAVEGSVLSDLKTADGDHAITLVQVDSTHINGMFNDGSDKVAFSVTINADGSITVTQNYALEHNDDGNTPIAYNDTNSPLTLDGLITAHVVYEDFDHDTVEASGNIGQLIRFFDDGPSVHVTVQLPTGQALDGLALITGDDGTEGAGSTTDSTTANFGGAFAMTSDGGADGTASSTLTFDLNLIGAGDGPVDSGLDSHGATIYLYQIDANTIVGSTSATAVGVGAGNTVFQLSTTDAGAVTLTQYMQVDHPIAADPSASGAPFADQFALLDSGLIQLAGTGHVVDNDNDFADDTQYLDLGGLVRFADDGPAIDVSLKEGAHLIVDESLPGTAAGETEPGGTLGQVSVAISSLISISNTSVSADAPTTYGYALVLGTPVGGLVDSGLMTSDGNHEIYLYNVGGTIVGSTSAVADGSGVNAGNTVFTVALSGSNVVLTQYQAIEHGDAPLNYNELSASLASGALGLQVTATDYDGDTDTGVVDLGSVIQFNDDGPTAHVTVGGLPTDPALLAAFQLVTMDDGTEGAGSTMDSTTANFGGLFGLNADGGSDGIASTSLTFDLDLMGAGDGPVDSGLDSHGQSIYLYQTSANSIVASTSATAAGITIGNTVFTLTTTDAGAVTLTQYMQVDHTPESPSGAPFNDQFAILDSGLVQVVATGSVTDNDGDIATDTQYLDLGGLVRFADDGPAIDATIKAGAALHIDESLPGTDGAGETDAVGLGQVTVAVSAIVNVANTSVSADEPTTYGYALVLGPATGGLVASGLMTSNGDLPIYLYNVGGTIVGSTALTSGAITAGNTAFTVALSGGNVVMTQYLAIEHTDTTNFDENSLPLAPGALGLQVTATDYDGDTATDTVDLGSIITFGDDGPSAVGHDLGAQPESTDVVVNVSGDIDGGSDGIASVAFVSTTGTGSVTYDPVLQTFTYHPGPGEQGTISFTYRVTDNDGDHADATISFSIEDSSPVAIDVTAKLDDDGLSGNPASTDNDIDANDPSEYGAGIGNEAIWTGHLGVSSGGADTPLTYSLAGMAGAGVVGTENVLYTWNGATNTLTATTTSGSRVGTTLFTVQITDTHTGDYQITLVNPIMHAVQTAPGDETSAPNVVLTYTVSDSDVPADTDEGTITITFNDDAPTAALALKAGAFLVIDETDGVAANGFETDSVGGNLGVATMSAANLYVNTSVYGADGAAAMNSAVYSLQVNGSTTTGASMATTLITSNGNLPITLYLMADGSIAASTSGTFGGVNAGNTVFTVAIAADGTTTMTQYQAIEHSDFPNNYDETSTVGTIPANGIQVVLTVKDADGDLSKAVVDLGSRIQFEDDGPNAGPNPTTHPVLTLDESAAGTDTPGGTIPVGDRSESQDIASYFATANYGSDSSGTTTNALVLNGGPVASGLYALDRTDTETAIDPIGQGSQIMLEQHGSEIWGVANGQTYFTISLTGTTLTFTQAANLNLWHPNTGSLDEAAALNLAAGTITIVHTVTDSDGDKSTAVMDLSSNTFAIQDDGPRVVAGTVTGAVGEDTLPGGLPDAGDAKTTSTGALSLAGLVDFGTDQAGGFKFDATAIAAQLTSQGFKSGGVALKYNVSADGLTLTAYTGASVGQGNVFTLVLSGTNATFTLLDTIDHNGGVPLNGGGDDQITTIDFSGIIRAYDADGDSVALGANSFKVTVEDDVPSAAISIANLSLSIDESTGLQADSNDVTGPLSVFANVGNKGVDPDMSAIFAKSDNILANATHIISSNGSMYGADGAGSTVISISTSGGDSGLKTTDGTHIFLFNETVDGVNVVVGRIGADAASAMTGSAAFAITADPSTGSLMMVEYLSIQHNLNGANPDDSVSLAQGAITATVSMVDFDGDISTASAQIGNLISFQDSAPVMTSAQNINIENAGDLAHTGAFAFNLGADGQRTDFDTIKEVTFSAVVNGVTVQTTTPLTQVSENATTATFSFSFDYDTGSTGTAHETGTIVFNKATGTYTVDLDNPIAGISLQSVQGDANGADFYTGGVPTSGSGEVAVSQLGSDFFIQFTGREGVNSPASGFGDNDLWNGPTSTVKISSVAIGVHGNSVQDKDVLDYNFFSTSPGGTVSTTPTTSASTVFIKVTQFNPNGGGGEDFVITLKLADPSNPSVYIERTFVVDSNDVLTTAPAGYPALGNTEGYIIFEPNDYQTLANVPDNYQIVGMQLRSSTEGVTSDPGQIYTFNGQLGASGGYDGTTTSFGAGQNDNDVFKIIDIGVLRTTTTNQTATLTFNVTVQDGDNDSIMQTVTATITSSPDSTSAATLGATSITPVVLDTNHDGHISFLGADAGVLYDVNGDGHLDHTAWAAPGDSILFLDEDGNGTVSGASEFVFGGNGVTDLEALHAMYGDQLDANDADFTMFGLWSDANSNGIVDAGEVSTLAEAGITSISLVSDGVSETAAGGDVAVAGSGTYTYVNENGEYANGKLADAAFAYRQAMMSEEQRIATSAGNASLLAIAAAAMGLAEQAAAHTPVTDGQADGPVVDVTPVVTAATSVADSVEPQVSPLAGNDDLQPQVSQPAPHHNAVVVEDSQPVADHAPAADEGPAALPQGTSLPVVDVTPLVDVAPMTVAGEAAAPTVGGGAHHNAVVVSELVTQPETSIEQVLAKLGGGDAADQLAIVQSGAKAVQGWDMGDFTHLPIAAMEHMGAEASLLHPDAVQPVVHG